MRVFIVFLEGISVQKVAGYPKNLKTWPEARIKALGIDARKRVHIVNIEPFAIVDSRGLSRMHAARF